MLVLRQRSSVINLAAAARYYLNLSSVLRNRQRAGNNSDLIVRRVLADRYAVLVDRDRVAARVDAFAAQRDRSNALTRGKAHVFAFFDRVVRVYCIFRGRIRDLAAGVLVVRIVRRQLDRTLCDLQRAGSGFQHIIGRQVGNGSKISVSRIASFTDFGN